LKTHGFQHSVFDLVAFLHGKTPVFPTPFPDFQSNYRLPPPKGDRRAGAKEQSTPSGEACHPSRGEFSTKYRRLKGPPTKGLEVKALKTLPAYRRQASPVRGDCFTVGVDRICK